MPIVNSDIQYCYSGGSNPDTSLGGAIGGVITSGQIHNLFDKVSGAESEAGTVEYRCIYVKNNHASLTLEDAVVWIQANTPSPDTTVAIGLGTSAIGGEEDAVANETTAPAGVTFSTPEDAGSGLSIGNLPAGGHKAIWLRRTVNAGASAFNNDGVEIRVQGDTAA